MGLINGRSDFDEQFFSKKTGVSKGTDLFTLGGDFFSIKTNLEERNVRNIYQYIDSFSQPVTIDDIVRDQKTELDIQSSLTSVELNFDKSSLTNFSYFGSLKDNIQTNITEIVSKFPASLFVNNEFNDVLLTVLDYNYDVNSEKATFKVPVNAITNNYNLSFNKTDNIFLDNGENLRNISTSFSKYVVWYSDTEYPIVEFTGQDVNDNYIYLTVKGNVFTGVTSTALKTFHIKPVYEYYNLFLKNLNDFQSYLLNRDSNPKYSAIFKVPNEDNEGNIVLVDETFTWKTTDGYNLDYDTYEFEQYSESLIKLAKEYDDYKTNLIARYLTASSIKEFDTEEKKVDKLLKIYGYQFDEIKKYIDGLAHLSTTSYDKKDNMPDVLVKNFARTLGWGTFSTVNERDLMKSFLGQDTKTIFSGQTKNLTPVETDIELWRRLVINTAFLFKSKGTRNCIDFLFKIIGAPQSLIDFNEYVYIAKNKINVDEVLNNDDLNLPFDAEGYPKPVINTTDNYFQMKGGWTAKKEIVPTNDKNFLSVIGIHTGDYDGGSSYFKNFSEFNGNKGFELERTVDNIKSWNIDNNSHILLDRSTKYTTDNNKLILNSKEASIYLNIAKPVETDVYEYNKLTGFVINPSGLPVPYPSNKFTQGDVTKMSFLEYTDFIYTNFINVKNRKVIETYGNGYPTLKKLYEDYYAVSDKKLDTNKVIKFIEQIGDFWINLVEQFVPSTTIWQGGVVYKNTIFDRQKFDYKQGENDGSEFETEQLANTDISVSTVDTKGNINLPYIFNVEDFAKVDTTYTSNLNFPEEPNPDGGGEDPPTPPLPPVNTEQIGILRVKPFIDSDIISISEPCLTMEKVSKIVTGTTAPIIHNISEASKEVDFIFDCNTEFFLTSEGNKFTYTVYPFNFNSRFFEPTVIHTKTFTGMTPTYLPEVEINETMAYSFADGDYLIKPSYKFKLNLSGNTHTTVYNYIKALETQGLPNTTGLSTDGLNLIFTSVSTGATGSYGMYNVNSDYWFSIISNPYKPVIKLSGFDVTDLSGSTLVNESIVIESNDQKVFLLNEIPSGDIMLQINGNTISESNEPDFSDDGEYYCEAIGPVFQITLRDDIEVLENDVLNIVYLKNLGADVFASVFDIIEAVPSGTTAPPLGAFYNTTTNKYEYYFDFQVNVDIDYNQMVVVLNGNKLEKFTDYYPSADNPYKLVFTGQLDVDDVFIVYYPAPFEDLYYLTKKELFVAWQVQNDSKTGLYTVEVATDADFNNIVMTKTTPYVTGSTITLNDYDLYVGNITTPFLKYYYRIKSEKYHYNMLNELTVTTIYSTPSYFLTDNRVLA